MAIFKSYVKLPEGMYVPPFLPLQSPKKPPVDFQAWITVQALKRGLSWSTWSTNKVWFSWEVSIHKPLRELGTSHMLQFPGYINTSTPQSNHYIFISTTTPIFFKYLHLNGRFFWSNVHMEHARSITIHHHPPTPKNCGEWQVSSWPPENSILEFSMEWLIYQGRPMG